MKHFLALICCATICGAGLAHSEPLQTGPGHEFPAKVIAVLDGDTVLVLRDDDSKAAGAPRKIRLAEIDAPEKVQDFGLASRNLLAKMVLHKQVWVNTLAVDKYGRDIAQLKIDGLSINEEMVRRGMAWEYSNYHSDRRYIELQREARHARRGLWTQNDPLPPWQWRKQHTMETNASPVLSPHDFTCGAKRRCEQMLSCDEAFYYFTVCGLKALNPKGDGIPCEMLCGLRK